MIAAQRRRFTRSSSTFLTRFLTRAARATATSRSIKRRTRAGRSLSCSSASVEVSVTQGLAGWVTEVAAVRRCAPSDWPQCQGVVTPGTVSVTTLQPMAKESGKSGEGSPYGRREATVGRFSGRKPPRAPAGGPEPQREVPRWPAIRAPSHRRPVGRCRGPEPRANGTSSPARGLRRVGATSPRGNAVPGAPCRGCRRPGRIRRPASALRGRATRRQWGRRARVLEEPSARQARQVSAADEAGQLRALQWTGWAGRDVGQAWDGGESRLPTVDPFLRPEVGAPPAAAADRAHPADRPAYSRAMADCGGWSAVGVATE